LAKTYAYSYFATEGKSSSFSSVHEKAQKSFIDFNGEQSKPVKQSVVRRHYFQY